MRNMEDEGESSDGQARGLVMSPEGHVLLLHADMEVGQLEHKRKHRTRYFLLILHLC